jgi:DtxR family transcriptional regulator, Mn-dependent transcriptional regulator
MNRGPGERTGNAKASGTGGNGAESKTEIHQREEILELLWNLREQGRGRLEEVLQESAERDTADLLGKMERDGWVTVENGSVSFQDEGERRAQEVIRRHRLAERLFSEVLELEEGAMESSACQLEHILSPHVLDSVCTFLGHPPTCPHGKPIPRGACCSRFQREMEPLVRPLPDLKPGEEGRVVFITPKSRSRLERLSALGLIPGSVIRVTQKRPSYVLKVGETTLALDEEVVREIYIKKI